MRMSWWMVGLVVGCAAEPPPREVEKPLPNAEQLTFTCEANGLRAYDPSRSLLVGPKMNCTARVADRAGTPIAGAAITFLTEAGRLLASGPSGEDGSLVAVHEVAEPRPVDVEPGVYIASAAVPIAPSWMKPELWREDPRQPPSSMTVPGLEPRRPDPIRLGVMTRPTNNPRDNLVTLVAVVEGEEAFDDANGNGTRDDGERFTDLAEPFIDTNDDGTRDANEDFIDANGNRQWDGPNGLWDAKTKIWKQTRILWTGLPVEEDSYLSLPGVVGARPSIVAFPVNLDCRTPSCGLPITTRLFLADPWFNGLTHLGASDGCTAVDPASGPLLARPSAFAMPQTQWPAGEFVDVVLDLEPGQTLPSLSSVGAPLRCRLTGSPAGEANLLDLTVFASVSP